MSPLGWTYKTKDGKFFRALDFVNLLIGIVRELRPDDFDAITSDEPPAIPKKRSLKGEK